VWLRRGKANSASEPATKKRKIEPESSFRTQPVQSSFAGVLERLKEEAGDSIGEYIRLKGIKEIAKFSFFFFVAAEGGADSWSRPKLPRIDDKRDKIGNERLIQYLFRVKFVISFPANRRRRCV
jgi:DNA polymerase delta subunit 1